MCYKSSALLLYQHYPAYTRLASGFKNRVTSKICSCSAKWRDVICACVCDCVCDVTLSWCWAASCWEISSEMRWEGGGGNYQSLSSRIRHKFVPTKFSCDQIRSTQESNLQKTCWFDILIDHLYILHKSHRSLFGFLECFSFGTKKKSKQASIRY